jgi:hypothetical protein
LQAEQEREKAAEQEREGYEQARQAAEEAKERDAEYQRCVNNAREYEDRQADSDAAEAAEASAEMGRPLAPMIYHNHGEEDACKK